MIPRQITTWLKQLVAFVYPRLTVLNGILLLTLIIVPTYIYDATYVWQCTSLAAVMHPISRHTCATQQFDTATTPAKYKIAMLMMYDNADGNWDSELMGRVLRNRESYARRHGYAVINANDLLDRSRPAAWSKLLAMERHLAAGQFDYLLYIDMDVVVMNPALRLETLIAPGFDFVMTSDRSGMNTGVWFAKNTDFARKFLRLAWDQTQLLSPRAADGTKHPFEYEQRAFHFLTYSRIWQERHLPRYRGMDPKEVMKHFYMQPQCALNSYVLHPLDYGDREVSQYVPGDLMVHFAGKKGQRRVNLMKHYLDIAEAAERKEKH